MSALTKIEWTDATWNPVTGCSVVSPGCSNCYAMKLAGTRMRNHPSRSGLTTPSKAGPVWNGEVRFNEQWLTQPLQWKTPRDIFVCAHGDLFHEAVPDEVIDRVFAVMARCPQHTFQVLTKRAERLREYMAGASERVGDAAFAFVKKRDGEDAAQDWNNVSGEIWPLPNVWLGVSAEDQQRADERIPLLLQTPSAVRFVSLEPLLGPLTLWAMDEDSQALRGCGVVRSGGVTVGTPHNPPEGYDDSYPGLDWVIVGGESGPKARPMHPDWARSLRDQCAAADVPFFFKQWGEIVPYTGVFPFPPIAPGAKILNRHVDYALDLEGNRVSSERWADRGVVTFHFVGKRAAGRLLDGIEHNAMPLASRGRRP